MKLLKLQKQKSWGNVRNISSPHLHMLKNKVTLFVWNRPWLEVHIFTIELFHKVISCPNRYLKLGQRLIRIICILSDRWGCFPHQNFYVRVNVSVSQFEANRFKNKNDFRDSYCHQCSTRPTAIFQDTSCHTNRGVTRVQP